MLSQYGVLVIDFSTSDSQCMQHLLCLFYILHTLHMYLHTANELSVRVDYKQKHNVKAVINTGLSQLATITYHIHRSDRNWN